MLAQTNTAFFGRVRACARARVWVRCKIAALGNGGGGGGMGEDRGEWLLAPR